LEGGDKNYQDPHFEPIPTNLEASNTFWGNGGVRGWMKTYRKRTSGLAVSMRIEWGEDEMYPREETAPFGTSSLLSLEEAKRPRRKMLVGKERDSDRTVLPKDRKILLERPTFAEFLIRVCSLRRINELTTSSKGPVRKVGRVDYVSPSFRRKPTRELLGENDQGG